MEKITINISKPNYNKIEKIILSEFNKIIKEYIELKSLNIELINYDHEDVNQRPNPMYTLMDCLLEKNKIRYNVKNILDSFLGFNSEPENLGIRAEDYVTILLLHELGHFEDNINNPHLYEKYSMESFEEPEINAWGNGKKYIRHSLLDQYESVQRNSIDSYRNSANSKKDVLSKKT